MKKMENLQQAALSLNLGDKIKQSPQTLAHQEQPVGHPLRGVQMFLAALFFFACMDATTKYLSAQYNVPLVVAIRYIVNFLLMIITLAPTQGKRLVQTRRTGLVLVRAGCLTVGSLFFGLALQRMPVAETTAIVFLAPTLVMLIAGPVLREHVHATGWIAAAIGFVGVLLIVRPGGGLDATGIACVLCAVGATVAYHLLSRVLINTEHTIALLFYTTLVGSVCFGALLPWFWEGEAPTWRQALLFLSMGATGGLGHFLFTAAYRHAPASLLAPINYLQLLWAGALGWIVFEHAPDRLTILGMCVVAASGVMVALRSNRQSR
ncbi:S-adenosylmethionine uptake transporter [Azospirillaceae bacterium]